MATLAELRGRAQRLSDMENTAYVDNDEWASYANEGLFELHDLLIELDPDYALASTTINVLSGDDNYTLPTAFYKLRGVDWNSGGVSYALRPFEFRERNRYQFATGVSTPENIYRYRIQGDGSGGTELKLVPVPRGGATLTVWYVPEATALAVDANLIPGWISSGFEKYIVLHMTMRALQKEESVSAVNFYQEKMAEKARIQDVASPRDAGEPKRMVDVLNWIDDDGPLPWGM